LWGNEQLVGHGRKKGAQTSVHETYAGGGIKIASEGTNQKNRRKKARRFPGSRTKKKGGGGIQSPKSGEEGRVELEIGLRSRGRREGDQKLQKGLKPSRGGPRESERQKKGIPRRIFNQKKKPKTEEGKGPKKDKIGGGFTFLHGPTKKKMKG